MSHDLASRPATLADVPLMAQLVDMAGEGLPMTLWAAMVQGDETPMDVGMARASRDEGAFSWRNAVVGTVDGASKGMIITYDVATEPEEITPDLFVPLIELENMAPGTLYVNVLAVLPDARGKGLGRSLLKEALAARPAGQGASIILAAGNDAAEALYHSLGFREVARRPLVKGDWDTDRTEWVLLVLE
ncbi:GNAT family N-acetyltransferase [Gymnodinialimonas hymeniacidonis]|uniref:GNAT family N-acetyltransferase n=1 Tax=Gymnodinialimonas hymeniacidonis TaxID=3126508 RepID=UPI0034C61700